MRILELKNCNRELIQSMLPKIETQGFDTIQINNSSFDDWKSIHDDALIRGINIILELEKTSKPDNRFIEYLSRVVQTYYIKRIIKEGVTCFKASDSDLRLELLARIENDGQVFYDQDYHNTLMGFRALPADIAYLADYNTYRSLTLEELEKYRMFLTDLYFLLTASYENTLYSPITSNGIIDTSFLDNEKVREANKQLVRRRG